MPGLVPGIPIRVARRYSKNRDGRDKPGHDAEWVAGYKTINEPFFRESPPMLSQEQNDLITRVGPGTSAGALMRRYWQPAALVDELAGANRPVKPIKLLGESLVLFRDDKGRYGLIERACPHRGTDLAYGRLENGGPRCAFHGWLFDVTGKCLETPAEPDGSNLCANMRQMAYPVVEKSGILFAYMGPGE